MVIPPQEAPRKPPDVLPPLPQDVAQARNEAKQVIRAYLASISWADWNAGRVVAELDRLGLRRNTFVVFVTDHGYQLGEKGKWSKAGSLFNMGTRVPLLAELCGLALAPTGEAVSQIASNARRGDAGRRCAP
jgi:arylsulfatase A-like enzyme